MIVTSGAMYRPSRQVISVKADSRAVGVPWKTCW